MTHPRRAASLAAGLTLALVAPLYAAQASAAAAPAATVHAAADEVTWIPAQPYERLRLTVGAPPAGRASYASKAANRWSCP